jgi:HEAT repeat protein
MQDTASFESKQRALLDPSRTGQARGMFALMLGQTHDPRARQLLLNLLGDPDHELLKGVLSGLGEFGDETTLPFIRALLAHPAKDVALLARWTVKQIEKEVAKRARRKAKRDGR